MLMTPPPLYSPAGINRQTTQSQSVPGLQGQAVSNQNPPQIASQPGGSSLGGMGGGGPVGAVPPINPVSGMGPMGQAGIPSATATPFNSGWAGQNPGG